MSRTKAVFVAVFCSLGLSAVLGSTGASAVVLESGCYEYTVDE